MSRLWRIPNIRYSSHLRHLVFVIANSDHAQKNMYSVFVIFHASGIRSIRYSHESRIIRANHELFGIRTSFACKMSKNHLVMGQIVTHDQICFLIFRKLWPMTRFVFWFFANLGHEYRILANTTYDSQAFAIRDRRTNEYRIPNNSPGVRRFFACPDSRITNAFEILKCRCSLQRIANNE